MNPTHSDLPLRCRLHRLPLSSLGAPALLLGFVAGSCGGGGTPAPAVSGAQPGSIVAQPDTSIGSSTFVVDSSSGGQAGALRIVQVAWGRLVNVRDKQGRLENTDMVVGDDIRSDGVDYELSVNPITQESTVKILYDAGTTAYVHAFTRLDQFLTTTLDKSLDPSELPPFTLLPRNAAVMIRFNDLLDSTTIQLRDFDAKEE